MRATQLLFLLFALFAISFSHFQTSFATGGVINNCPFFSSDLRLFILENMLYVTVTMAVTPDPVQMPVATEVKPPMCPYENITVMVAEPVQRFVMFYFNRMRWRSFMFRGGFYAGDAHDTGQSCNS